MRIQIGDLQPQVDQGAWLAPTAVLVGDVHLQTGSSVWYGAVLRADGNAIVIGEGSNVQDGCILHADPAGSVIVGKSVVVGHAAVLHCCTVEDGALIGIGATVLTGAVVGAGSLIAAGALVPEGQVIPPRSIVFGSPGKVRGQITDEQAERIATNPAAYQQLAALHATATVLP